MIDESFIQDEAGLSLDLAACSALDPRTAALLRPMTMPDTGSEPGSVAENHELGLAKADRELSQDERAELERLRTETAELRGQVAELRQQAAAST